MNFIIIIAVITGIPLLPVVIKNQTKARKKKIAKKAKNLGINLNFDD